jgi:hypothetical protein
MIVAHVMGLPVEESALQLASAGALTVTSFTVFGRMLLSRFRRR